MAIKNPDARCRANAAAQARDLQEQESKGRLRSSFSKPGDLVTWMLPGNLPHIGIVTGERSRAGVPGMVHNIGRGPEIEDMLFRYTITGHYRYAGH